MNKAYFENIDGLRTMAVIPVIIAHTFGFSSIDIKIDNSILIFLLRLFPNAYYGVVLFFVISGFLITYLLLEEKKHSGRINTKYFYIRRVLRIWPLYFLVIFIGFLILPFISFFFKDLSIFTIQRIPYDSWWRYIFFMANYDLIFSKNLTPILSVLWSVSIEEQFYLIWPLIIHFFEKKRHILLIAILAISLVWRIRYLDYPNFYYYDTLSCLFSLTVGGVLAHVTFYSTKFILMIKNFPKYLIVGIYLIGFFFLYFSFHNAYLNLIKDIAINIFFAFVIAEQSFCQNSVFKLSNCKIISNAGKYTYGLYSLHLIALYVYVFILKAINIEGYIENGNILAIVLIVGSFVLSFILSYLSYHYYEKTFLQLKEKYSFKYLKSQK